MTSTVKESFGHKVGPFSVGVWLGIGAGGVGLALIIRRSSLFAPAPPPTVVTGDQPTPTAMPTNGPQGLGGYSTGVSFAPTGTPGASTAPAPTTNSAWERLAIEYLTAEGYNPLNAQGAIEKWFREQPVTTQEAALISQAVRHLGAPPETVAPAQIIAPGPTPPGNAPGGSDLNLSALSNEELGLTGNQLVTTGGNYRPYLDEVIRRIQARTMSINDPVLATPGVTGPQGQPYPTAFGTLVVHALLGLGYAPPG